MLYLSYLLLTLQMFVGLFLIGLVLLQRGRGGGLAGSFGGMGGQSAFGTKAGDIFTRVTIVVAVIWILLACTCILVVRSASTGRFKPGTAGPAVIKAPADESLEGAASKGAGDGTIVLPSPAKTDSAKDETEAKPDGDAAEGKKTEGKKENGNAAQPEVKKDEDAPANVKEKKPESPKEEEKPDSSSTDSPKQQ